MDTASKIAQAQFWTIWTVSTVAATLLGFIWHMSPLGLGFATWPSNPLEREILQNIYLASYFGGLPGLALAQFASLVLGLRRAYKRAYIVSCVAMASFIGLIGIVLARVK